MKNKFLFFFAITGLFAFALLASARLQKVNLRVHHHRIAYSKNTSSHVGVEVFYSHLPIITIQTNGQPIPGEKRDGTTISVEISVFDNQMEYNYLGGEPMVSALANIRYRGNSSMEFDKKGYLVNFKHEEGTNHGIRLLGMDKHHEWAFHGPYLDKTLIRNYMWYNIAGEMMDYAPNVRYFELFVDDQYQGVYLAVETITRSSNGRLQLNPYKKGDPFTSYILRLDRGSRNPINNLNNFTNYSRRTKSIIDIQYPPSSMLTEDLITYIEQDFSSFEKTLYSYDFHHNNFGYEQLIDIESFVDYFIINEFTCNYDAGLYSTYIYKDIRGKYGLVIWDFNNASDNYIETPVEEFDFVFQNRVWYFMLMKDEKFTEAIIQRYYYLRENILSEEYLLSYIDETVDFLGPSIDRNFEVWGYSFEPEYGLLMPSERNIHSYEEAIDQLKQFIIERGRWMDQHIETLRQFSHESKAKKFKHIK